VNTWEQKRWFKQFFAFLGEDSEQRILDELGQLSAGGVVPRRPIWTSCNKSSSVTEQIEYLMACTGATSYTAARFMVQTYQTSERRR
jgi:hypothetical protein